MTRGGQLHRALQARRRPLARFTEEQRADDGTHLTTLEQHKWDATIAHFANGPSLLHPTRIWRGALAKPRNAG
jgi:hypothetical protein